MLQNGSCQNSHLSINVIFKRLGVKAGINSLPFAIFVTQNKEKMNLRERFGTLCSRLGVEFQCPHCHSNNIIKSGKSSTGKQRYRCKNCQNSFITVYNIQSLVHSPLSLTTHISTSFLLLCCLVIE